MQTINCTTATLQHTIDAGFCRFISDWTGPEPQRHASASCKYSSAQQEIL